MTMQSEPLGLLSLQGKTALVTGASAGLGRATALAFAHCGANVVVTARRADRLDALIAEIKTAGANAIAVLGDATEEATARTAIQAAVEAFATLDILVCNAGAGNYKNLVDTSTEDYDALMDANMKSSFLFARHAAPRMIERRAGTILFISSIAGLQGYAGEAVYCASKFAQVGFAQAVDAELRKYGIKVGCICPGGIKTEFALGKGRTEESIQASNMMTAEDVAQSIVFACRQPANVRIPQLVVRHMG